MYTEEELQETIEYLEDVISRHDEALAAIVWALRDEENLSDDTKEGIKDAFKAIFGDIKSKK